MSSMNNVSTVDILKSLADETRLSLVRQLIARGHEVPSNQVITGCSNALKLSQPTISHHFGRLVQSGVLISRKEGTEKYYQVNQALLQSIGIDPAKL